MIPLIKREIKEFYIRERLASLVSIGMVIYALYGISQGIEYTSSTSIVTLEIYLIALSVFMLYSSILLVKPIYQEITEGKVEVLLGVGYSPLQIWVVKTGGLCGFIYISLLMGYMGADLTSYLVNGEMIFTHLSLTQHVILLFVAPILGMSIVSILTSVMFFIKNNALARYTPLLLFGILLFISKGSYNFLKSLSSIFTLTGLTVIVSLVLSVVFFTITFMFMKNVRKERLIN